MFKLFDRKRVIPEEEKLYQGPQPGVKIARNIQTLGNKLDTLISELESGYGHDAEIEKIKKLKTALQKLHPVLCDSETRFFQDLSEELGKAKALENVIAAYEACKDKLSDGIATSFWQLLAVIISWFNKDLEWAAGIKAWAEKNAKLYSGFEQLQNLDFSAKPNLKPIENEDNEDDAVYAYVKFENKNEFYDKLNKIFPSVTPSM